MKCIREDEMYDIGEGIRTSTLKHDIAVRNNRSAIKRSNKEMNRVYHNKLDFGRKGCIKEQYNG